MFSDTFNVWKKELDLQVPLVRPRWRRMLPEWSIGNTKLKDLSSTRCMVILIREDSMVWQCDSAAKWRDVKRWHSGTGQQYFGVTDMWCTRIVRLVKAKKTIRYYCELCSTTWSKSWTIPMEDPSFKRITREWREPGTWIMPRTILVEAIRPQMYMIIMTTLVFGRETSHDFVTCHGFHYLILREDFKNWYRRAFDNIGTSGFSSVMVLGKVRCQRKLDVAVKARQNIDKGKEKKALPSEQFP